MPVELFHFFTIKCNGMWQYSTHPSPNGTLYPGLALNKNEKWTLGSAQFNVTSLAQTWNCCVTWRNHNIVDAQYCILLCVAGWDFTVSGGVHLYSMSTVYVQEFGQVHLYSMFEQNASNSVHNMYKSKTKGVLICLALRVAHICGWALHFNRRESEARMYSRNLRFLWLTERRSVWLCVWLHRWKKILMG